MSRVAIFGGGIGGLSAAHYLSKLGYDVSVYESKDVVGGLARSSRDEDGCATEYCWRVYFSFYDNFLQVLNEIPVPSRDANGHGKRSRDLLVPYEHANLMTPLSFKDKVIGYYNILSGITACDGRLDDLDNLSWWDALGSTSDSNLFRTIGPWLGMDRMKGSFRSVIKVGIEQQIIPSYLAPITGNTYQDYITSRPTSEAIFTPWQTYLKDQGVRFYFGDSGTLVSLWYDNGVSNDGVSNGKIVEAYTKNGKVEADYFILSVPVEVLKKIITNSPSIDRGAFGLDAISKLKDECLHTQISLQLYFSRPISLGGKNAFLLVESPWDIIVVSYDQSYTDVNNPRSPSLCHYLPEAKGGWSVAATTAYRPGTNGKTLLECNEIEIKRELWTQLVNNKYLQDVVKGYNGFELNDDIFLKWSPLWPTFFTQIGDTRSSLVTSEPKFTNNAGSYKLRPSYKTYIPNLFIATAYIKETIDIFSMEAACIAGKKVANAIDSKSPEPTIRARPLLFAPFRAIDTIFWQMGLPNALVILVILLAFVVTVKKG